MSVLMTDCMREALAAEREACANFAAWHEWTDDNGCSNGMHRMAEDMRTADLAGYNDPHRKEEVVQTADCPHFSEEYGNCMHSTPFPLCMRNCVRPKD